MNTIFGRGNLYGLEKLEPLARISLERRAQMVVFAADEIIFQPGKECTSFLWVLEGSLRVHLVSDAGREITLYRVSPGQTCVLTTTCLISGNRYGADAIVEEELSTLVLPAALFKDLLSTSEFFRKLIFGSYGKRITGLISDFAEVAFGKMDQRLAHFLFSHNIASSVLTTHQELANELGTAREVISRLLNDYEKRGLISLHHMRIDIVDEAALKVIAGGSD